MVDKERLVERKPNKTPQRPRWAPISLGSVFEIASPSSGEGIDEGQLIDALAVLQVFGEARCAIGFERRGNDQAVVKTELKPCANAQCRDVQRLSRIDLPEWHEHVAQKMTNLLLTRIELSDHHVQGFLNDLMTDAGAADGKALCDQ